MATAVVILIIIVVGALVLGLAWAAFELMRALFLGWRR